MAKDDDQLVRELYAAFTEGNAARMQELFAPDVVWHQSGRSVLAGDHWGVQAVFDFFGRVAEISGGTFTVELHGVMAGDGHAVSMHTGRGQAHGQTLEDHNVLVCHCSAGRITEVWEHHEDLYAVDDFWGQSEL